MKAKDRTPKPERSSTENFHTSTGPEIEAKVEEQQFKRVRDEWKSFFGSSPGF